MPLPEQRERRARHLQALAGTLAVGVLLLVPLPALPAGPPGLPEALADWLARWGDKLAHAALFFGLAALLHRSFRRLPGLRRPLAAAVVAAAAYGALLEIVQGFLPYRSAELADGVADLAGGVLLALASRTPPA